MDKKNRFQVMDSVYLIFGAFFVGFQLYTTFFGVLPGMGQRGVHLIFMLSLLYFGYLKTPERKFSYRVMDCIFLLMSIASIIYIMMINNSYMMRSGVTIPSDIIFGVMLIVVLMEATRRTMGWSLCIITGVFIVYAFVGKYLPGLLAFGGYKLGRFIHITVFTSDGILGSTLSICATYIVLFIILGCIFQETGVGNYFTALTSTLFGKLRGGPAKVSVIASALFGSISGSSVANVVGTGTFTIPMMKKIGFKSEYAGAVEASASTGGQIMPPIMGAASFVMAEMIQVPYASIVKAAWIPAILYFVAIIIMIDLNARKNRILGADSKDIPSIKEIKKDAYLLLPMIFLILMLSAFGLSVSRAGMYTVIFTILVVSWKKSSRLDVEKIKRIILNSVKGCMSVAVACSIVGIISAVVLGSGLGFRLSNILIKLSGGHLIVLLVLTMITSIILGMGLPTTPAYLILASLVAPALTKMGVSLLAAHMFIFYFGIISNVTPPVAMAAYAAAGIAGGNPSKTGFQAFKLSLSGFLLPFIFVYNNLLLAQGSFFNILGAVISALFGIYCLSAFLEGYYIKWEIGMVKRIVLIIAALTLIYPGMITDLLGLCIAVIVAIICHTTKNIQRKEGSSL